jgi:hypothetical protein
MRSENCFLFAAQKSRRLDRHVAQHLILGIDQPPLAVDFVGFGGKRLHRRLKKGTEATGREGHCQPAESEAALVSRGIVLTLIIDDGVRSRGHRKDIFNPKFNYAAAAFGPRARYRTVCSIDFAGGYAERAEALVARNP